MRELRRRQLKIRSTISRIRWVGCTEPAMN